MYGVCCNCGGRVSCFLPGETAIRTEQGGPVSRVLFLCHRETGDKATVIHLDAGLLRHLKRPTRNLHEPDKSVSVTRFHNRATDLFLFGLASDGVYLAGSVTRPAGELLPHRFTLAGPSDLRTNLGGLLSVALSLALRPVGVTHHRVLRSPDFPPGQSLT